MEFNTYPLPLNRRERRNSSTFSSTLLDAIYRSIDESDGGLAGEEDMVLYRQTKKQSCSGFEFHDEDMARHRRACLIEKWMEKKVTQSQTQIEKVVIRRRSAPEFDRNPWGRLTHSSSSSSDSSSAGGFSSSEAESIYGGAPVKPKPVRTTTATSFWGKTGEVKKQRKSNKTHDHNQDKKSKTTAMKIYDELKKAKNQPISPGGRLASFLNSLFTTNKSKSDDITAAAESKSGHASTCSSASSFSRSCLSTGSKTGKRTVRFNFDDDYQPYSRQKSSYNNREPLNTTKSEVKIQTLEKKYNHKMTHEHEHVEMVDIEDDDDDQDEDDDAASYASSDLFELDNLSAIGIDRYCKELPVYETTHVHTNRAIANGLIP